MHTVDKCTIMCTEKMAIEAASDLAATSNQPQCHICSAPPIPQHFQNPLNLCTESMIMKRVRKATAFYQHNRNYQDNAAANGNSTASLNIASP